MPSPHLHILGSGNVGSLIGGALKGTVPPSYVTFIMRSWNKVQNYGQHNSTIHINRSGQQPGQNIESKIPAISGHPTLRSGGPEPITNLIVTTRAPQTHQAIESMLPSIHKSTNILLLQNGMGMYESLCEKFWPNKESRPNFYLGINTHGVHNTSVPFSYNHIGSNGKLYLTQVPSEIKNLHISPGTYTASEENVKSDHMQEEVIPGPSPKVGKTENATSSEESVKSDYSGDISFPRQHNRPGVKPDATETPFPTASEEASKADSTADPLAKHNNSNSAHKDEILSSFLATGSVLNAEVLSYAEFLLAQYDNLIANACVNPVTAILNCKNKDLLEIPAAEEMINAIVTESSKILKSHAQEIFNADTMYAVNTSLDPKRLVGMVREVIRSNPDSTSLMLADVYAGRETELANLNDFIINMGYKHGHRALVNRQLSGLVRAKSHLVRRYEASLAPLVN